MWSCISVSVTEIFISTIGGEFDMRSSSLNPNSQCPADVRHMESVVTLCPCHDNQSAGEDQSTLCLALIGQLASHPASDWLLVT